jgi:hypothetical protein
MRAPSSPTNAAIIGGVVSKRKRSKRETDPLAVYRRIRKPMPPPERIVPDKRRELDEDEARREIEEGVGGAHGASADARAAPPHEEER